MKLEIYDRGDGFFENNPDLWTIKEAVPIYHRKYNIGFGYRQIHTILQRTDVLGEYNYPMPDYDNKGYFVLEQVDINSPKNGEYITNHYKIHLTRRGMIFVARHLQANKGISLKRTWGLAEPDIL